jgi:hypothetical protein
MIPLVIASFFNEIQSTGFAVAKYYIQFCGLHILNVPIHHAPFNEQIFLRQNQEKGLVMKQIFNIVVNTQQTPPVFSKIFLYNFYNLMYPRGRTPLFIKYYFPEINHEYANAQIQFMQSSTVYDKMFYFYPVEGFWSHIIHRLLIPFPYREAYGLFSTFGRAINDKLIKLRLRKTPLFHNGVMNFYFKYLFQKNIVEKQMQIKYNKPPEDLSFINDYWQQETNNFLNYITQFITEFKSIVSNLVTVQIVSAATDLLDKLVPLGKNARSAMFYPLRNKKTLRETFFSPRNSRQVLSFFKSFDSSEVAYQILNKKKKMAKTPEDKKKIQQEMKNTIKFPRLLMIGKDAENYSQKFCYYINSLVRSYTVYFDCFSLKQSLRYLSGSPEAAQASFLTRLFRIIRHNIQLKQLFVDTKHLKYRLDLLIFNDVSPLLKDRFHSKISINDLLAITMFLETLSYGARSTYLFTIPNGTSESIDKSVMNMIDYCINLEDIDKKIKILKIKKHVIELYQTDFKKNTTIPMKNMIKWSLRALKKNNTLTFEALEMFFYQLEFIAKKQKVLVNDSILELLANYLKLY